MKYSRVFLVALALGTPSWAEAETPAEVAVRVLEADRDRVSIVVEVDLKEGWKTYYKSAEGYDTEMALHWDAETAPAIAGYEILWPEYETFDFYGEQVRGYRSDVDFPISITLADGAKIDSLKFTLEAYFCSNLCVREEIPYEIALTSHQLRLPWAE